MSKILGIDTSNYTTSAALLDTYTMQIEQEKMLLPVKQGEKGIRQSDAVFHHTVQLPKMIHKLFEKTGRTQVDAIGVSFAPRLTEGSYMPCFMVGDGAASSLSSVLGMEPDRTSHQIGHILAGLYSCKRLDLLKNDAPFIAFHASGGTTDLLLCEPDKAQVLKVTEIGRSLDLKAGQAVDRVGVMLGMQFPCGKQIDSLACESDRRYKVRPVIKGLDCCLSGVENLCRDMFKKVEPNEDIARFCIEYLKETFVYMLQAACEKYGKMPIVCVGGVMSNSIIRAELDERLGAFFADAEFSCDNAAGVALYSAIKKGMM